MQMRSAKKVKTETAQPAASGVKSIPSSKKTEVVAAVPENPKKRTLPAAPSKTVVVLHNKPEREVLSKACEALLHHVREHRKANEGKQKSKLLPGVSKEEEAVFLQIGLRNMPNEALKTFKGRPILLPHSFRTQDMGNVCLLVKDKAEAKKWLGEDYTKEFGIKKMISLEQLRTRHKSFQAKRELVQEYDAFIADDRIACMLPKTLGKAFYVGNLKRPLPIRFATKDIKEKLQSRIKKALQSTFFYLSGVSTSLKVGDTGMTDKELVDNLEACIKGAVEHVPKKWKGVQAMFVKAEKTAALPIYEKAREL